LIHVKVGVPFLAALMWTSTGATRLATIKGLINNDGDHHRQEFSGVGLLS
jgi:hypothetical protein